MSKGPYIIVRRGRKHRSGPEAVIDDLKRLRRAHNEEYRELRERRLKGVRGYRERLQVLQEARRWQHGIAKEATQRLDEYDW